MITENFYTIATKSDRLAIETLIDQNSLYHRHLDWSDLGDWIENHEVILCHTEKALRGVISIPLDEKGNNWVRLCAINKKDDIQSVGQRLFDQAFSRIRTTSCPERIFSISLWLWYEDLLKTIGFQQVQSIITLERVFYGELKPSTPIIRDLRTHIGDITENDITSIHILDNKAFSPPWQLSLSELTNAYHKTDYRTCIKMANNVIAYQLSSLNESGAHISRIAVDPHFQKNGWGRNLLNQIFSEYASKGVNKISVNTQSDNLASISLYNSLDFKKTNDDFPVYSINIV